MMDQAVKRLVNKYYNTDLAYNSTVKEKVYTEAGPGKCTCNTFTLMNSGCKCGNLSMVNNSKFQYGIQ